MNKVILLFAVLLASFLASFSQDNDSASVYLDSAKYSFEQFDFESSEVFFQKIVESDSLNRVALEGLADSKINLGKKGEAFNILGKLSLLDSDNNRIAGKKASLLMDFDRFKEAEEIYSKLCLQDSTNAYFSRKLAISVYRQDEFIKAITLVKKYLELQPSDNEMKMVMANSYHKLDSFALTLYVCEDILKNDSLNRAAISKAGFVYFINIRDYEKALGYYEKLNRLENNSDPFHLKNLGICKFFTGNPEHAAILLDSLSDQLNDDAMIPFYAGLSYKRLGKVDEALLFLQRAATIAVPVYTADIYHHLGRTYSQKRMFEEALQTYAKVREIDPSNYQVLFDIAVTYEEYNMNYDLALPYYNQYVKECTNSNASDLKYAQNRIQKIKEQLFFEGK